MPPIPASAPPWQPQPHFSSGLSATIASVVISKQFPQDCCIFYKTQTDANGIMNRITLPAPDRMLSDALYGIAAA